MNRRIVLIGFSATGKSAVGRRLAERLGWRFLDTDQEIVKRSGKTIAEIFHGDGEDVFRDYERKLLEEAGRRQGIVVAAGGGAVLVDRMRALMQKRFFIVCLEARPETLFQRLLKDKEAGGNPVADLLTRGDEPVDRISYLKEFRQPYYAVADWTVHTTFLARMTSLRRSCTAGPSMLEYRKTQGGQPHNGFLAIRWVTREKQMRHTRRELSHAHCLL